MSPKKAEPEAVAWPLFGRLPVEIQIMIFHEALRKPQIHFADASRHEVDPVTWKLDLKSRSKKKGDTSGYHLVENIQDVARDSPVAAEAILKSALQPLLLPIPVRPNNDWRKIDAATDLVVFEFSVDKSGKLWLWHPRNQLVDLNPLASHIDSRQVRKDLRGIRKVAFVYGGNKQPSAGSSESVFQCLQHHNGRHSGQKFCPEELLGFIYQLSDIEAVYIILHHRVNKKPVTNYAASYFSVPAATRNTFGLKTFYSTTRSYITVPLPSCEIGPVFHATWKTKDYIWPHGPSPPLVNAVREAAMARPPDSREGRYVEHVRKLSHLAHKLDHHEEVYLLVAEMILQIRADQNTPLSPDWPLPTPPQVNTAQFRTLKQHHKQRYNLENFTKERRDNLEFGMLLMVDETAVFKNEKSKSKPTS
ncbi:hypothetical protein NEUTE1DRAFT_111904 [Neurospora tetrasperma FGSC 2508]|uniref:Uncharacterized protein n=1 Tax=Neurospora tetrasperma (strain FGSC 2508 / ATCC MYA-4615 / P0657) TaxID=510951 RepID=F8MTM9_NEUT8|nr:uncharacterized protein NEUTE1DRAFT_111904 [Neurospora tetrasperma FGSC 2508]EGO55361.1 hypothetical protein NEUTE1DRAFT_111904 [Neurospora tetrasperma FGSC 2508]EGZ69413.1 hypothetical protein NEUTE2DRAFT_72451 [Neurospora tetrasperma FGSC 2509]